MQIKRIFFVSILFIQSQFASTVNIEKYLDYLHFSNIGRIGDFNQQEMQIVDDYNAIYGIQQKYYNEFIAKGCNHFDAERYSRVGVVEEDKYWIWFRDPLILPNGKTTAYNRFFPKSGLNGSAGVSVMGISQQKEILVNVIFRHATREWEMELPRGGREKDETSKQAALREFKEETGITAKKAFKIGSIASDSGILANVLDIFVTQELSNPKNTKREDCEIIHECLFISKNEIKKAFVDGFTFLEINKKKVKVFCRDPFLASALLIAETKEIL
jgi:ADP-ribose diphosphatase